MSVGQLSGSILLRCLFASLGVLLVITEDEWFVVIKAYKLTIFEDFLYYHIVHVCAIPQNRVYDNFKVCCSITMSSCIHSDTWTRNLLGSRIWFFILFPLIIIITMHYTCQYAFTQTMCKLVINPRRACAARVTVLGLCVCVCVCVSVSTYSCPTGTKPAHQRYQRL